MSSKYTLIASTTVGTEFGHVPGHRYHDVTVSIDVRRIVSTSKPDGTPVSYADSYRVVVTETTGSAQGTYRRADGTYRSLDQQDSYARVSAEMLSLARALALAGNRARAAHIDDAMLVQALSDAESDAESDAREVQP